MLVVGLCLLVPATQGAPVTDYRLERVPAEQLESWRVMRPHWERGELVLQGFLGANLYQTVERSGGSSPDVDGSDEEASELPVIGGGGQWKLGGERIDFGLEAMFSLSGRANATAFAAGGGGAAIAVDVDMLLFEVYGGPVANLFLGDDARVYVSAGPLMQWADFTQENDSAGIDDTGAGFGTGLYARTGIEFRMSEDSMIGLGCRWSESSVDLDNDLGTLDLDGFQVVLTVTEGF